MTNPDDPMPPEEEKLRPSGLAGDDLAAADDLLEIEDVVDTALVSAVLAVTAVAVGLEDGTRLVRQIAGRLRAGRRRRAENRNHHNRSRADAPDSAHSSSSPAQQRGVAARRRLSVRPGTRGGSTSLYVIRR